tara:strand:+ start:4339 stop:6489 length:2151 start_codon:yes stop_codon:yes gene_type:complete
MYSIVFFGCNQDTKKENYLNYPSIDKVSVQDNYFGTIVTDDYRHLENLNDSTIVDWFKAQDQHTDKHLGKLKSKATIAEQMRANALKEKTILTKVEYANNGFGFFLKSDSAYSTKKLFYIPYPESNPIELLNPNDFQKELNREYTINYLKPSWDGRYILVALGYDGIKGSELIIVDVLENKILPEIITNTEPETYLGVSWLPDSNGFLYLYIPEMDKSKEEYMLNCSTVLYKLGEDPKKRNIIFSAIENPNLTVEDYPIAKILSNNDKYLIGYVATVENYWSAFYAEIKDLENGEIDWKPLYTLDEKVYADYGCFIKDQFIYISGKNADNHNISSFDVNTTKEIKPEVVVPEKEEEVISSLAVSNNIVCYTTSRFGVEAFLYSLKNNVETKVELPSKSGYISLNSPSNASPKLFVGIDGWTIDYTRYVYENGQFTLDTLSSNKNHVEFDKFLVKEIQVASHDGVLVPLSIIYRGDMSFDGLNPTFIYTYGAYGESLSPFYSPIFLNWVQNGGVFVVPHIRGGGEKGDSWHEQGMKLLKSNSWKDIIACTEYLIENEFTSKDKTVLYSSSAGTIATGMAIVERPDLYQVFIADVPMLNPLRSESRTHNSSNYLEYGTIKDSLESMGLIKMDPYVNLKYGEHYPASLVISAFNDSRIDPWIPGKFVAKLQDYSKSDAPVFLDVIYDEGHSGGDTSQEQIDSYSKIFAFAFWQTHHDLK